MRATPAPDSHFRYVDNFCPFGLFDYTQISTSSPVWIKKQSVQVASGHPRLWLGTATRVSTTHGSHIVSPLA